MPTSNHSALCSCERMNNIVTLKKEKSPLHTYSTAWSPAGSLHPVHLTHKPTTLLIPTASLQLGHSFMGEKYVPTRIHRAEITVPDLYKSMIIQGERLINNKLTNNDKYNNTG